MRASTGRKQRSMNSKGGDMGLCVPPSNTTREGSPAMSKGGSTVWNTRHALPAVPTAKW
jgi:hypothetical protein